MSTKVGILIVSDTCYSGKNKDTSGENLKNIVKTCGLWSEVHVTTDVVPDEKDLIANKLIEWSDQDKMNLILTTGGTGFSPRDVTPEATKSVISREAPGLSHVIINKSLNVTSMAMLSRPVAGMRGTTLIINFPGSKKAAQECFEFVKPSLRHAVDLLNEQHSEVVQTHKIVQEQLSPSSIFDRHSCGGSHQHHEEGNDVTISSGNKSRVDISKVAHRCRESPYPLVQVNDAVTTVLEEAKPCGIELVNYKDALHRILAEDVFAKDALPPFPASIKDGYAVITSDGAGPRKVSGDSTAGSNPTSELVPGLCMRISTGAPVPKGADAVVQVYDFIFMFCSVF